MNISNRVLVAFLTLPAVSALRPAMHADDDVFDSAWNCDKCFRLGYRKCKFCPFTGRLHMAPDVCSVVFQACIDNDIENLKKQLEGVGNKKLDVSCKYSKEEIMEKFPNCPSRMSSAIAGDEFSPLGLASGRKNRFDIVAFLLENGADPNFETDGCFSGLMSAIYNDRTDVAKLLLGQPNINPNQQSKRSRECLPARPIFAAIERTNTGILELLLARKDLDRDVKHQDRSPLQYALARRSGKDGKCSCSECKNDPDVNIFRTDAAILMLLISDQPELDETAPLIEKVKAASDLDLALENKVPFEVADALLQKFEPGKIISPRFQEQRREVEALRHFSAPKVPRRHRQQLGGSCFSEAVAAGFVTLFFQNLEDDALFDAMLDVFTHYLRQQYGCAGGDAIKIMQEINKIFGNGTLLGSHFYVFSGKKCQKESKHIRQLVETHLFDSRDKYQFQPIVVSGVPNHGMLANSVTLYDDDITVEAYNSHGMDVHRRPYYSYSKGELEYLFMAWIGCKKPAEQADHMEKGQRLFKTFLWENVIRPMYKFSQPGLVVQFSPALGMQQAGKLYDRVGVIASASKGYIATNDDNIDQNRPTGAEFSTSLKAYLETKLWVLVGSDLNLPDEYETNGAGQVLLHPSTLLGLPDSLPGDSAVRIQAEDRNLPTSDVLTLLKNRTTGGLESPIWSFLSKASKVTSVSLVSTRGERLLPPTNPLAFQTGDILLGRNLCFRVKSHSLECSPQVEVASVDPMTGSVKVNYVGEYGQFVVEEADPFMLQKNFDETGTKHFEADRDNQNWKPLFRLGSPFSKEHGGRLLKLLASDDIADNDRFELTDKLLQQNADPNINEIGDKTVRSPLQEAVARDDEAIAELLIEHGAQVNLEFPTSDKLYQGHTEIAVAVSRGNADMLTLFRKHLNLSPAAIDYEFGGGSKSEEAMRWRNGKAVDDLGPLSDEAIQKLQTFIRCAQDTGLHQMYPEVMKNIVFSGSGVANNYFDKYTPMMIAAATVDVTLFRNLVQLGFDPNKRSDRTFCAMKAFVLSKGSSDSLRLKRLNEMLELGLDDKEEFYLEERTWTRGNLVHFMLLNFEKAPRNNKEYFARLFTHIPVIAQKTSNIGHSLYQAVKVRCKQCIKVLMGPSQPSSDSSGEGKQSTAQKQGSIDRRDLDAGLAASFVVAKEQTDLSKTFLDRYDLMDVEQVSFEMCSASDDYEMSWGEARKCFMEFLQPEFDKIEMLLDADFRVYGGQYLVHEFYEYSSFANPRLTPGVKYQAVLHDAHGFQISMKDYLANKDTVQLSREDINQLQFHFRDGRKSKPKLDIKRWELKENISELKLDKGTVFELRNKDHFAFVDDADELFPNRQMKAMLDESKCDKLDFVVHRPFVKMVLTQASSVRSAVVHNLLTQLLSVLPEQKESNLMKNKQQNADEFAELRRLANTIVNDKKVASEY